MGKVGGLLLHHYIGFVVAAVACFRSSICWAGKDAIGCRGEGFDVFCAENVVIGRKVLMGNENFRRVLVGNVLLKQQHFNKYLQFLSRILIEPI